jgi:hypothetical protein
MKNYILLALVILTGCELSLKRDELDTFLEGDKARIGQLMSQQENNPDDQELKNGLKTVINEARAKRDIRDSLDTFLPKDAKYIRRLLYGVDNNPGDEALINELVIAVENAVNIRNELNSFFPGDAEYIRELIQQLDENSGNKELKEKLRIAYKDARNNRHVQCIEEKKKRKDSMNLC